MIKLSSRYRSLLVRGASGLLFTFLLLCGTGCRGGENTDKQEVQPITTEVSTTCTSTTTTTSSSLTTSSTTTTTSTTTTELMTAETVTTIVWENTVAIEPVYVETQIEYVPPATDYVASELPITEYERTLLRNVVANEYGSDWVSVQEKAKVVATVMNRVNSPSYPNTIEEVLTQPYQFSGYYATNYEWSTVTNSVRDAVDYYFEHPDEFGSYTGFWGDGTYNHFY